MKYLELNNLGGLPYKTEEAMNRLRINLGFCGDRFKKIIITSSTPNEGKSFISTHLWRMLAETGYSVALVDADIRKSMMRSRYQLTVNEGEFFGITHYLSGQAEIDEVVYETKIPGGYLIPTTHAMSNPAILLQSVRFPELLNKLAEQFNYVLVDTPPLSNVADGNLIASQCDGGLLVVRSGVTPRKLVGNSIRQLQRSGCELMGVILNRVEAKNNPYYYKYKKYSYDSGYYGENTKEKNKV